MPMPCGHPVVYIPSRGAAPRCCLCNPPAAGSKRKPYKIGLLQPDGSVWSKEDVAIRMERWRWEWQKKAANQQLQNTWADGDWGIVEHKTGPDGWPVGSRPFEPALHEVKPLLLGSVRN